MHDVVVVGAGAAGLSCARELMQRGLQVSVLEARSRVGGRVHTLHPIEHATPVELGAEFIHGHSHELMQSLNNAHLPFYDVKDLHHLVKNGRLTEQKDFWNRIERISQHLPRKASEDHSVEEHLKSSRAQKANKDVFRAFVEGFHAADLKLMSSFNLGQAENAEVPNIQGTEMFRHPLGYDQVFKNILSNSDALNLGAVVKKISWSKNKVHITCVARESGGEFSLNARKIVITWPHSLWKLEKNHANRVEWSPGLPTYVQKSVDSVETGHVQRLVFRFHSRFWESLAKKPIGFMHTSNAHPFPTWWTHLPFRTPYLTAWQGGPKALSLSGWPTSRKINAALKTLQLLTGKSERFLNQELEGCYTHDWSTDQFSLGAYSYVKAGASAHVSDWTKPIENTVYIAGEATVDGANRGTVNGAIESGVRAARQILADFKRESLKKNAAAHSEQPRVHP
jgi:monoamine oxidase